MREREEGKDIWDVDGEEGNWTEGFGMNDYINDEKDIARDGERNKEKKRGKNREEEKKLQPWFFLTFVSPFLLSLVPR